jgi:hypothetical protein
MHDISRYSSVRQALSLDIFQFFFVLCKLDVWWLSLGCFYEVWSFIERDRERRMCIEMEERGGMLREMSSF